MTTDYKQKYDKLVEDIRTEAKRRGWMDQWQEFAKANGIEVEPEKKYPEAPKGDHPIIKWKNWMPVYRQGSDPRAKWVFVTGPGTEYTWEELVDRFGRDLRTGEPIEFEVLYGGR